MSSEVNAAAEAGHHAAAEALTPTAYIAEHLQNLNNTGGAQTSVVDFSVINLDTIFWTSLMGLLTVFLLVLAARGPLLRFQVAFNVWLKCWLKLLRLNQRGLFMAIDPILRL